MNPRRPDSAFGVVEEDREIFSEGTEGLVDGSVEEGAFNANNILHKVRMKLWGKLFEGGFEIAPDRGEGEVGLDGGKCAGGGVVGEGTVDGWERQKARKAA